MSNNSNPENSDEEGLDAAKEEINKEPESGLGPGADGEEETAENDSDTDDKKEN